MQRTSSEWSCNQIEPEWNAAQAAGMKRTAVYFEQYDGRWGVVDHQFQQMDRET
jgi:hypothetical protein